MTTYMKPALTRFCDLFYFIYLVALILKFWTPQVTSHGTVTHASLSCYHVHEAIIYFIYLAVLNLKFWITQTTSHEIVTQASISCHHVHVPWLALNRWTYILLVTQKTKKKKNGRPISVITTCPSGYTSLVSLKAN